jgi:copper transport protein
MLRKRARGALVMVVVLLSLVVGRAAPAYAHANLVATDPVDGITLDKAPGQVRLWFSDNIMLDFTRLELHDGDGRPLALPPYQVDKESTAAASTYGEKKVVLLVQMPPLAPNAYRLNWQTRSADDLHVISGSVTFGVQRAVSATNTGVTTTTQPGEVILRWLGFGGLAGLVAGLTLAFLSSPATGLALKVRRRLSQLSFYAGLLALAAGCGSLILQGWDGAAWWPILTRTDYGLRWWLSQALLSLVLVLFLIKDQRSKIENQLISQSSNLAPKYNGSKFILHPLSFILVLFLVVVHSQNGHGGSDFSLFNLVMDSLHLLGALLWTGGLAGLVVAVAPLLKRGSPEATLAWVMLRRFGWIAAACLVTLIVTGLYKSGQQVASLDGLLTTLYGQALLLKVELVLVVGLVGLLNAAMLHPRLADRLGRVLRKAPGWKPFQRRHLGRVLLVEAIGGGALLLLAAFLTATQPARGPEFDPPPVQLETSVPASQTGQAADLLVNLAIKPNRPGQNFLSVNVFNSRKPAPAPLESIQVRLKAASGEERTLTLEADNLNKDRYQLAGGFINKDGDWNIEVTVQRPGLPEAQASFPWKVQPAPVFSERRAIVFSNQPLAPWLNLAAVLCALLGGIGFWWVGVRPKFRGRTAHPSIPVVSAPSLVSPEVVNVSQGKD